MVSTSELTVTAVVHHAILLLRSCSPLSSGGTRTAAKKSAVLRDQDYGGLSQHESVGPRREPARYSQEHAETRDDAEYQGLPERKPACHT